MLVRVLDLLELRRLLERRRRLVREGAEDLQPLCVRAQPVERVVGPDVADARDRAGRAAGRRASGSARRGVRGRRAASGSRRAGPAGACVRLRAGAGSSPRRRTRAGAGARAGRRRARCRCSRRRAKPTDGDRLVPVVRHAEQLHGDLLEAERLGDRLRTRAAAARSCPTSRSSEARRRAAARALRGSPWRASLPAQPERRSLRARETATRTSISSPLGLRPEIGSSTERMPSSGRLRRASARRGRRPGATRSGRR